MCVTTVWVVSLWLLVRFFPFLSRPLSLSLRFALHARVCVRNLWAEATHSSCQVCDVVWVSYQGRGGDVTVREFRQQKQMSSADGYPAVASPWDTYWSQMLMWRAAAETYEVMTVNKAALTDITSCPPFSRCLWLASLDRREEIWIVEKTEDSL